MTCPSEHTLIRAALGELAGVELTTLDKHLVECRSCSSLSDEHRSLAAWLRRDTTPASESHFVQSVMARCDASTERPAPATRRRWVYGTLSAAAAAAAVWFAMPRGHFAPDVDVVTARGTSRHDVPPVTIDVLVLHGTAFAPIEGAALHPGDRIGVRYWNSSNAPAYLAVFGLDAANTVHWIYPAYLRESQDPPSIRLGPSIEGKWLNEVVEPEAPAVGAFQVVALVTAEPLTVHGVESKLVFATGDLARRFPKAQIQQWSCSWNVR